MVSHGVSESERNGLDTMTFASWLERLIESVSGEECSLQVYIAAIEARRLGTLVGACEELAAGREFDDVIMRLGEGRVLHVTERLTSSGGGVGGVDIHVGG